MVDYKEISDGYQRVSNQLIIQAGEIGRNTFLNLGNWRDDDKTQFIEDITNNLAAAKKEAAQLAFGYHDQIAKINGQSFIAPKYIADDFTTDLLRNKSALDVYSRPFREMRTQLAKGYTMSDAIEAGARRAQNLAQTETQLARRNASLIARRENDNIVGYLRVLSGSENCALCYVASTQRYRKGDLLPIHPGCDCGELPIYGDQDVGQVIDEYNLDRAHEVIADRFGGTDPGARLLDLGKTVFYRDGARRADFTELLIREHGELGPVLAIRGQKFTGPNDLVLKGTTTKRLADAPVPIVESAERSARVTSISAWADQVDEFKGKASADPNYQYAFKPQGGDELLSDIAEKQGFRGKPTLVNSVDDLDDERVFRVLKDDVKTRQVRNPNYDPRQPAGVNNPVYNKEVVSVTDAKEFVDQIKTGAVPYYGHGIYGNGIYFGNKLEDLAEYAGDLSIDEALARGNVVQASISPNARLFRAKTPEQFQEKVRELAEKAAADYGTDFDNPFLSLTRTGTGNLDVESDQISRLFAMEGFDGYQVPKIGRNPATGELAVVEDEIYSVILNRTILKVVR